MNDFDPYFKWLGIKPEEQPATLYRLLGVAAFESDPDVIEAAAEQRMVFLRNVSNGPRGPIAQRLLNEVFSAQAPLLNDQQRAVYDAGLRRESAKTPTLTSPPISGASMTALQGTEPITSQPRAARDKDGAAPTLKVSPKNRPKPRSSPLIWLVSGVAVGGIGLVLLLISIFGAWEIAENDLVENDGAERNTDLPAQSPPTINQPGREPSQPNGARSLQTKQRAPDALNSSPTAEAPTEPLDNSDVAAGSAKTSGASTLQNATSRTDAKPTGASPAHPDAKSTPTPNSTPTPGVATGDLLARDVHPGVATTKGMQNTTYRLQAKDPVDIRQTMLRCQIWRDNKPNWRTNGVVELSTDNGASWQEVARWDKALVDAAARAGKWHTFSLAETDTSQPLEVIQVRFRRTQYHSFYIGQVDWIMQ